MDETISEPLAASPEALAEPEPRRRRRLRRLLSALAKSVVVVAIGLMLMFGALMAFLDTGPGHRFIVDRIAAATPPSGLRIRIGRIEGSIWGHTRLRDVRLYDPDGLFAESPEIAMNWRPIAFLFNRLLIHELESDLVIVHRLANLVEPEEPGPILPDYDIHIGRLDIRQLRIDEGVAGGERIGSLSGEAEIRRGRALIGLQAEIKDPGTGGGDRMRVRIDAEPDRDRFDMEARIRAPVDSVFGAMIGTRRPVRIDLSGDGSWTRWNGDATLDISGRRTAELGLRVDSGRFRANGWAAPAPFLRGRLQRLTAPRVLVNGSGAFADRRLDARLSLRSASLRVETRGAVDLGRGAYDGVEIAAELIRPAALFRNMSGRQVRLTGLLDGRFGEAAFVYRITAPRVAFARDPRAGPVGPGEGITGFEQVQASGRGRLTPAPVTVPLLATARRVTGVGDVAGGILANLRLEGALQVTARRLTGERLVVTSDRLRGQAAVAADLRNGDFVVAANLGMRGYPVPGFGVVDVQSELRAVPGPGRRGTNVTGRARAQVTRFDNGFLSWVAGGLPQLETALARGPDGIVRFENLRIAAPKLAIAARGIRRRDGTYSFDAGGEHGDYGPLRLSLEGRLERPRLAVELEHPVDALGLADVFLNLEPNESGFAWNATGASTLGPFTGNGFILLPAGRPAIVQVAALNVSGTRASGTLRSGTGGFAGRLDVAGGGLDGRLLFSPVGTNQRVAISLAAENARFIGPPEILVRRGTVEGVVVLDPAGNSVEGRVTGRGLSRGALSIASLDAQASLRGGVGQVRAQVAGSRGRNFAFSAAADVAPGRYRISGSGTLDRRPLELSSPALLTRSEEGWRLAPTRFTFAGGGASLSGLFGERTEVDARLEAMPLTVLDIFYPDLGLGGIASGLVRYRSAGEGAPPAGEANLRVRGLTRAGLVLSSRPVDLGLNARLDGVNAAMRAVAVSEGRTIGRAQARISPIGGSGTLLDRLTGAPMRAQIRYNGAADTLWRLTGIELIDLSGPAAIGADLRGSLRNPVINGSVQTAGARLESAVTGMVIENLQSVGRFGGSRLQIQRFRGTTPGGGTVEGSGNLDFATPGGVGMSFDVRAQSALLLDRDDIRAAVTGPISIRSDGGGGTISGNVRVTEGRFQLGSATAAAQVPRLNVEERNRIDADLPPLARNVEPWRLALDVRAPSRMMVTGLGMNSEWRADVRVAGTVIEPRITGSAELLRGTYDFAGRRFDLIRGNIHFEGETPVDPTLDIAAEARVRGLNAQIRVTGRSQRPEIAFTSTPALPQDELLSRILFGTSITNLSAPEAVQLAAAVASLNNPGGGLDPINALRGAVGLDRLRVLPADVTQGIGTQLAAGKYLGRRVYVEVVTDGRGYSATTVEYQITRWLSLLSSISTIGRESVNVRVSRDY
ncbi:translocation/assembly module TamB domain-containing protein [Sphingosinicella sp. CPCC 101087]|uniref:translocation/assembly module TamB domain-containing protein n=1 Tax=Sphingosinicella sp. CPCC 101087 TaxID=2497754 RepID=UPI001FB1A068|nr:translocation/assembly module TamB domain-containing protein [Sphingosinicella sp. CPCC 101087]